MSTGHCKKNIIVALSVSGRSFENLLRSSKEDDVFSIVGVISSSKTCKGFTLAKDHQLPIFYDSFKAPLRPNVTVNLRQWLSNLQTDYILLAGFLRPFPHFDEYQGKVLNIHPALLPAFGGKGMYGHHVHAAVLAARCTQSGATVHFVNDHYDEGQILAQTKVDVYQDDTPDILAARVFAAEKKLYPQVLRDLIAGSVPQPNSAIKLYEWTSP